MLREHEFSYNYFYHTLGALEQINNGNILEKDLTRCIDCEGFTDYNRWHYLFKSVILTLPEFMGLHPEAGFWLVQTLPLFISWLVFVKTIDKDVGDGLAKYISGIFYVFAPIRISYYFGSSTLTGLQHFFVTIMLAFLFKLSRSISTSSVIKNAIVIGICMSFSLNIAQSNVHIFAIAYVFLSLYLLIIKKMKVKHFFILSTIVLLLTSFINAPFIYQHITLSIRNTYPDHTSLPMLDALFFQSNVSKSVDILVYSLFGLILAGTIFNKLLSIRVRFILIFIYIISAILTAGHNGLLNLANYVFNYIPTFSSLRSMYRFNFFQIIIFCLLTYSILKKYPFGSKYNGQDVFRGLITILILIIVGNSIFINIRTYPRVIIPDEYASIVQKIRSLDADTLIFPPYSTKDILNSFSWSEIRGNSGDSSQRVSYYTNVFKTIYYAPKVTQLYDYGRSPSIQNELFQLDLVRQNMGELIDSIKHSKYEYIVVDGNYLWGKIYPDFDLKKFKSNFRVVSSSGKIEILKINDKKKCIVSKTLYFLPNHCANETLSNFEKMVNNKTIDTINPAKKTTYLNFIMSPSIRLAMMKKGLSYSSMAKEMASGQDNAYVIDTTNYFSDNADNYLVLIMITNSSKKLRKSANRLTLPSINLADLDNIQYQTYIYDLDDFEGSKIFIGTDSTNGSSILFSTPFTLDKSKLHLIRDFSKM